MDVNITISSGGEERKQISYKEGIITLPNNKQYKVVLGDRVLSEEQQNNLADLAVKLLNQLETEKKEHIFEDLSQVKITEEGVVKTNEGKEASILKPESGEDSIRQINSLVQKIMLTEEFKAPSISKDTSISFQPILDSPLKDRDVKIKITEDLSQTVNKTEKKAQPKLKEIGKQFKQVFVNIGNKISQGVQKVKTTVSNLASNTSISSRAPKDILEKTSIEDLAKLFENPGNKKLKVQNDGFIWTDRSTGIKKIKRQTATDRESKEIVGGILSKIDKSIESLQSKYSTREELEKSEEDLKQIKDTLTLISRLEEHPWIQDALENNSEWASSLERIKEEVALSENGKSTVLSTILENIDSTDSTELIGSIKQLQKEISQTTVQNAVDKASLGQIAGLLQGANDDTDKKLGIVDGKLVLVDREFGLFRSLTGRGSTSQQIAEALINKMGEVLQKDPKDFSAQQLKDHLENLKQVSSILEKIHPKSEEKFQFSWVSEGIEARFSKQIKGLRESLNQNLAQKLNERISILREEAQKQEDIIKGLKSLDLLDECAQILGLEKWKGGVVIKETALSENFKGSVSKKIEEIQEQLKEASGFVPDRMAPKSIREQIESFDGNVKSLELIAKSKQFSKLGVEKESVEMPGSIKPTAVTNLKKWILPTIQTFEEHLTKVGDGFSEKKGDQKLLNQFQEEKALIKSLKDSPWVKAVGMEEGTLKGVNKKISNFELNENRKEIFSRILDLESEKSQDPSVRNIRKNYLISYRKFQTTEQFFGDLLICLNEIPQENIGQQKLVLEICKEWLQNSFLNSGEQDQAIGKISEILNKVGDNVAFKSLKQEIETLNKIPEPVKIKDEPQKENLSSLESLLEDGIKATSKNRAQIVDRIADNLFSLNAEFFLKINVNEIFLDNKAVEITKWIQLTNSMANLCVKTILENAKKAKNNNEDPTKAIKNALEFFVSLGEACLKKGDFHSLANLFGVLNSNPILRMVDTKKFDGNFNARLEHLEMVGNINYKNGKHMMEAMQKHSGPFIPFWGLTKKWIVAGLEVFSKSVSGMSSLSGAISPVIPYQEKLKDVRLSEKSIEFPEEVVISEDEMYKISYEIKPSKQQVK